jgi:predicted dehydrogenase
VRILIAGLGAIGQRHARNLRALRPDAQLLAYRSRRLRHVVTETLASDESRDVEAELGIRAFTELDAVLAERPDAVFVCTPSSLHLEVAQRSAEAGCHLFIEKPVSHTMEGVERLRAKVESGGLVAMVGCQWRFHPLVRQLRALLRSAALGPLQSAHIAYAEYLPDWHPYEDYRMSYAARAQLGGGVVLTQIHDYDLAWWLFGAPHRVRATGGHLSDLEIDVEDTVDATLETAAVAVRVTQTMATRPPRRSITVEGEQGRATLDLLAGRLDVDARPPLAPVAPIADYQRNQMFVDEAAQFLECLQGRVAPAVPLSEGIAVLRIALAVKESLRTGHAVELT